MAFEQRMVTACRPARAAKASTVRALALPSPMPVTAFPPLANVYLSVTLAAPLGVPSSAWYAFVAGERLEGGPEPVRHEAVRGAGDSHLVDASGRERPYHVRALLPVACPGDVELLAVAGDLRPAAAEVVEGEGRFAVGGGVDSAS
ncbi:hypothetical protein [Streptomyces sp. NPDC088350]|uniref:hypothetical protein n=1 Tax=Streptomyces sp. NPDC088350 TaxID=3365854 RepID=UPI0038296AED